MPPFSRDAAAEALSRYREALTAGAPEAELTRLAEGLDPGLVATVRWSMTRARQARPTPETTFVRDLRRELVQAASASVAAPPTLAPRPPTAPPIIADVPRDAPPPLRFPQAPAESAPPVLHPRWDWRQFAAAAVLALMLAGGVLLARYVTVGRPTTQLAATGAPTVEVLVDASVQGAAATYTPLTVQRWQFLAGATLSFPALDGPQWIVADTGPFTASVDGQGQSLAPGQSVVVPGGQTLELHNPGLAEAALYRGVASAEFALPVYDRAQITEETAFDTDAHESLPPGSSRLVFERLTVPPGTTLKMQTATGTNWFDVVSGQLGLTLIGDSLPLGWESERERELAPEESIPLLVPGTRVWLHNLGDDPLVLLLLRIDAEAPAATPAAVSAASAGAGPV